ncbi:YebC/PmpR family DNA-binding transcriptional regulator [uncultured Streptococcus sp.]|uniref:YebC/PmpR family DNA-binding transcriptional regulator n=1 Tax=uncultured Streptococcus sp. TaxID=83427 RepID=UPI0025937888|nr:YebC/PmpR family DNA-binding transcriptional regulator [uncultured Streptococcus sp.]
MSRRQRRTYSKEFKQQIVDLYLAGKPRAEIIREYELTPSFDKWMKQAQNLEFAQAQLSMIPQNYVSLDDEQADTLETLVDKLEDDDDVQDVYTNMAE